VQMKNMFRLVAVVALCLAACEWAPTHAQEQPRVIEVHAKRFSFAPAEITIAKGETVTLSLTSDDTTHGLSIPELGVNVTIMKGKPTTVEVTPQQAGTFEGRCNHFCGVGHGSMVLSVQVKDK
jgi:cytochrome c oxidase subunit II